MAVNASDQRQSSSLRTVLELLLMVVIAIALAWALKTYVVQPYEIPSGSMEPTIEIGDRVLSEKVTYRFDDPQVGDIVTFTDPTGENDTLIKRIVATGGQLVEIKDGQVYVNGVLSNEDYSGGRRTDPFADTMTGVDIEYPYQVPEGMIWVMGDNRTDSADSRFFGPVSAATITGRAVFTYWPIPSIGTLE